MSDGLIALQTACDNDRDFLAGMIQARGKCYVGETIRAGKIKWSPSLSLEVSGDPVKHWWLLGDVFGEPHERRYYGKPSWRYVTQDRAKIASILTQLTFRGGYVEIANAMVEFCQATTEKQEKKHVTCLRGLVDE